MLKKFSRPNSATNVAEKFVVNFRQPELGLNTSLVRSDEDLGGFSTASLQVHEQKPPSPPFARFSGETSSDLPEDRPDIVRLGYAMFRTKDSAPGFFGLGPTAFHDWSDFNQLSMRVRGDYRKYFINVQADTPYPTDSYQHRSFLKTPGEWETVTVSFANFISTNGGVIQQQQHLPRDSVKSVGVGLIDGQYGPFQLDIEWIKVHNGLDPEYQEDAEHTEAALSNSGAVLGTEATHEVESGENISTPMGEVKPETTPTSPKKPAKTPGQRLSVDDD